MALMHWICRCGTTNVGTTRKCKSCGGMRENSERKDKKLPDWLAGKPKK